jgi:hypothetical protein
MTKMLRRIKIWWVGYDKAALQRCKEVMPRWLAAVTAFSSNQTREEALKFFPVVAEIQEFSDDGLPLELQLEISMIKLRVGLMALSAERLIEVYDKLSALDRLRAEFDAYSH